jgi:EmrB/QacA subfamily drug resistance transporter
VGSALHPSCDAASASAAPGSAPREHPRLTLAACILASSLAFIDGSVVNVGLPSIGRDLHVGATDLQWVINAYLLPLSALLLFGGALGDRFGRRLVLILGVALFAVASVACAMAPTLTWLLCGRVAQGIGAAMLMPSSLAILGATFQGESKGRAIGIWAAAGAMAGALGPVLGGWLIDTTGWRAIFYINLPLALGAIGLAGRYVRDPADSGKAVLDLAGAALATAALGALTWGLTLGAGRHGWSTSAATAVAAGVALSASFLWVEHRKGDRAMMPLALFASREFVGLTLLTFLLYGALGGLLVPIPYVLLQAAGYSGTAAGAALLPFPLILAATAPIMGGLAGRTGPRLPLSIGPVVVAVGFLLATRVSAGAGYWGVYLPAILVIAMGMAGAVAPLTAAVLGSVDARHTGSASGFNSAVARTGGLVATALLGSILAASGPALIAGFRLACAASAVASLGAGASAGGSFSRRGASCHVVLAAVRA